MPDCLATTNLWITHCSIGVSGTNHGVSEHFQRGSGTTFGYRNRVFASLNLKTNPASTPSNFFNLDHLTYLTGYPFPITRQRQLSAFGALAYLLQGEGAASPVTLSKKKELPPQHN